MDDQLWGGDQDTEGIKAIPDQTLVEGEGGRLAIGGEVDDCLLEGMWAIGLCAKGEMGGKWTIGYGEGIKAIQDQT
jgi:hypothetical protein